MALTVDTRTATEYGVVRTFAQGDWQFTTLGNNTFNPNTVNLVAPIGSSNLLDTAGGGYVAVELVFMQFAGFTFGKSASAYATPWHGYPGNNTSYLLGGHDTVTGVNNIQYTAQFGNGVSATVGLDDPVVFNRTVVANLNLPLGATGGIQNAYAGVHAPDFVGNIRIDQAWGLFQISGAVHEVNGSYNILNSSSSASRTTRLRFAAPARRVLRVRRRQLVGNLRPPLRQMGRIGDGCVADQEHPVGCRRRHQDGCDLVQG